MTSIGAPSTIRRGDRQAWITTTAVLVASLTAVNGFAYLAAPTLFEIDRARAPYTVANNYELTRVYSRAITEYEQVVKSYPDSKYAALAAIGIANSRSLMGDRSEAIATYRELLTSLGGFQDYPQYRLTLLAGLAAALQDAGDGDGFREVYGLLRSEYPDAEATKRSARYASELEAAATAQSAGTTGVDGVELDVPSEVRVGERFNMTIAVAEGVVAEGAFGLAINLSFWDKFRLVKATPSTTSVSEFWGKRFQEFTMPAGGAALVLELEALQSGPVQLDMDLEKSFDMIELNIVRTMEVTE